MNANQSKSKRKTENSLRNIINEKMFKAKIPNKDDKNFYEHVPNKNQDHQSNRKNLHKNVSVVYDSNVDPQLKKGSLKGKFEVCKELLAKISAVSFL